MTPRYVVLSPLVVLLGMSMFVAAAEPEAAADEEVLRAAHVATDGPGLLAFFRKRTLNDEAQTRIAALIAQLGSESFALRQQASAELASLGSGAAALLRQATRHADLEIRWRARQALADIRRDSDPDVLATAIRVLGRHGPRQTTETLLAYLPCAEDPEVAEEVCLILASAARRDGEAELILARALTDRTAVKRGAAAAALCRAGCRDQAAAVRRLLRDPDPFVRQRVALALLETREKTAVPILIALLTELPQADAERIEEKLVLLAGEKAPSGDLDGDAAARRKYRAAWTAWWTLQGEKLDLTKIEGLGRPLGYTLIAQTGVAGSVQEIDRRGRLRWQIDVQYPIDVQAIDAHRVLIAEYSGDRVTERNHKGEILWQTRVDGYLIGARRLSNGRTFIATRTRVYEVNSRGDEVWTLDHSLGSLGAAYPLRDGHVVLISRAGEVQRLDRDGKVLKSFRVARGGMRGMGAHMQALPNGHILVPLYRGNSVVEYDADGKAVWSVQAYRPTCAQRLPNGHTLISSQLSNVIVELDRKGREVWSHRCDGRPMRVQRR